MLQMHMTPRYFLAGSLMTLLVLLQFSYILRASVVTVTTQTSTVKTPVLLACLASPKGGKPPGSSRDCGSGQGVYCTKMQPCTPCSQGGCQPCSAQNLGECYFVSLYGPYCTDDTGFVGPCTKCCS